MKRRINKETIGLEFQVYAAQRVGVDFSCENHRGIEHTDVFVSVPPALHTVQESENP